MAVRHGGKPKLGQNFLIDLDAMQRIVDAVGELAQTTVIEIGPGAAALTELLAARARRLLAVELDRELVAQLRQRFAAQPNVSIVAADILQVDLAALLADDANAVAGKARVVGNLPYYITSDILLKLFAASAQIETLVVMVQKEVAERVAAEVGTHDYGLLSATAQMYGEVELLFALGPEAFAPPPKVSSAVFRMRLAPRFAELGVDEAGFLAFLKRMFAQKRKTVSNNLKLAYDKAVVTAALAQAELDASTRAEAIALPQMARLYRALGEHSPADGSSPLRAGIPDEEV